MKTSRLLFSALAAVAVVTIVAAGELEPAAPPAPTMLTLQEVAGRTPIRAADLPLTITEPGSYYLAEEISTSGAGIEIATSDVTIDLMGHTLRGGTGSGINAEQEFENIEIRNGAVADWDGSGIRSFATNTRVLDVRALRNGEVTGAGIITGERAAIHRCSASGNVNAGLETLGNSLITDSIANDNDIGIWALSVNTTIVRCKVEGNRSFGIWGGGRDIIRDTTVENNGLNGIRTTQSLIADCQVHSNGVEPGFPEYSAGIHAGHGSIVTGSRVSSNTGPGIEVAGDCQVIGNTVWDQANAAGILITQGGSRIQGNHLFDNAVGLLATGSLAVDNVIINNTCGHNTLGFDVPAGNDLGPVGTAATSTSPWANIEY